MRELFRLLYKGKITTPFNIHHDLPLLANSRDRLQGNKLCYSQESLEVCLQPVYYDGAQFKISNVEKRPCGQYLIELIELMVKVETS